MIRNLGSVCAKLGRRGRSYCAGSKTDDILEEKPALTFSGILLSTFFGYVCYRVKGRRENYRLYDKREWLSAVYEYKVAKLDKAQKELSEKAPGEHKLKSE